MSTSTVHQAWPDCAYVAAELEAPYHGDEMDEQRAFALLAGLPVGDRRWERVRERIARRYLGLADSLARHYRGRGEPHDDIVQAGRVGLVKAIDRFDPARGPSFTGYATRLIIGEIKRHFRDTTWSVHVPRRLQELRIEIREATREFNRAGITDPTPAQLATHLGMAEHDILQAQVASNAYTSLSLDAPADGAGGDADAPALGDIVGQDDSDLDQVVDLHALRELLDRLPEREKTIVLLRFYGNQTQRQIADQLGLSQMHISRLLNRTLRALRQALTTDDQAAPYDPASADSYRSTMPDPQSASCRDQAGRPRTDKPENGSPPHRCTSPTHPRPLPSGPPTRTRTRRPALRPPTPYHPPHRRLAGLPTRPTTHRRVRPTHHSAARAPPPLPIYRRDCEPIPASHARGTLKPPSP